MRFCRPVYSVSFDLFFKVKKRRHRLNSNRHKGSPLTVLDPEWRTSFSTMNCLCRKGRPSLEGNRKGRTSFPTMNCLYLSHLDAISFSLSLCLSLSQREKDRESKKETDSKRCVFVNFAFILSGEWKLTVLPCQQLVKHVGAPTCWKYGAKYGTPAPRAMLY